MGSGRQAGNGLSAELSGLLDALMRDDPHHSRNRRTDRSLAVSPTWRDRAARSPAIDGDLNF
jgi:hypothetical protein